MESLSAIRQMWAPAAQPLPLPKGAEPVRPAPLPLDELQALSPSPLSPTAVRPGAEPFGAVLGNLVQEVNARQLAARETVNSLLSGQPVPLHQAMIGLEEASVSFQLMVEVRNKLLEAYQELMRMQI